jgi:shikimate kinase
VPPSSEHPDLSRSLALIGGRGCGKSSVSKRLARRNKNFMLFSVDALIRYERGGITIPQIIERDGWAGFRELEYEVVNRLAAFESGALIDCGGGVVVDLDGAGREVYSERKVAALGRSSLIVYLSRDFAYLRGRIEGDENRPSLSSTEDFVELMERRDPWYRRAADHVIDCNDKTKLEIAEEVLHWFYDEIGVEYTADFE